MITISIRKIIIMINGNDDDDNDKIAKLITAVMITIIMKMAISNMREREMNTDYYDNSR